MNQSQHLNPALIRDSKKLSSRRSRHLRIHLQTTNTHPFSVSLPHIHLLNTFYVFTMNNNNGSSNNNNSSSNVQTTDGSTEHALTSQTEIETAKWTRYLPQAFGIRQTVQGSKYRWCVRESSMWAIATGTAMTLHRFRMQSPTKTAVNIGFGSLMVVYVGSYYFCVKKRDYREKVIHIMMQLNSFEPALDMPEPVPVNEYHPFVVPAGDSNDERSGIPAERQYVANLPERKEWQPQLPRQDADRIFTEVPRKK
jgi:hypothetical protein